MKEIIILAEAHQQLAKQAYIQYSVLVDDIINTKSTDQKRIEHTLDGLLDFCYDFEVLLLYRKLCRHFYTINQKATIYSVNSYREMWDSDSLNDKEGGI